MKRVIYLFMIMLAIGAMCPSCGGEDTSTPDFDYEPIKPDLGDDEEEDEGKDEEGEEDAPDQSEAFVIDIKNFDFEEEVDFTGEKGTWKLQSGWHAERAKVTYEPNEGYNGSACIKIECINDDNLTTDVPISQTVTGLIPEKLYELSAMIKVKSVVGGRGGNVGLYGEQVWLSSEPFIGSYNWQKRSVKFIAESETVDIACRLGFTAGDSRGTAWFDNVALTSPSDMYHRESEHVALYVEKELVNISNTTMDAWLARLDQIYDAYTELFPFFLPFEGKKMIILSGVIDAWAYAGYPIQWNRDYIESTFTEVQRFNSTVFGIMHEMGHNFAPGNYLTGPHDSGNYNMWNWNEELFANFRMYYALDKTNLPTYINNQLYNGSEIIDMYREQYEKSLAIGKADGGDGLMYIMCEMVNDIGWEPYIATFRELYDLDPHATLGNNRWPKIEYFFKVLSKHADKTDILAEYLDASQIELLKTL